VLFKVEGMNVKLCPASVMICSLLSLIPALSGLAPQNPDASKTDQPSTAKQSAAVRDGSHDFDFIYGKWRMPNHRLKKRLAGSHEWVDFVTCDEGSPLPGGIGDIDYWKASYWQDFVGVTVRTYDPKTGLWRIYWVDNTFSGGTIQPPVIGKFDGNVGIFEGSDTFNGIPIIVRYTWTINPKGSQVVAKWEQAFSTDSGKTWETNWYNEFIHDDNCTPTS
jgi:hypothetical protein